MKIDLLLCEEDRQRFGAPEVLVLDTDRVRNTPAGLLIRWEAETNYAIERALDQLGSGAPAAAVLVWVWLARKQMGPDGGGQSDEGRPEPFAALIELRTMLATVRLHVEPEQIAGGDAVPPATSPGA